MIKILKNITLWLKSLGREAVFYIGGSDTLPAPLSPSEEALAVELLKSDPPRGRRMLIEHNLRLVVYIARKFENTGVGIEDLISTGGSVLEVVEVLRAAGAEVLGIVSIFTYGMKKGIDRMAAANVKNVSLTNFDEIAEAAAEEGYIAKSDIARLIAFRNDPSDESWIGK